MPSKCLLSALRGRKIIIIIFGSWCSNIIISRRLAGKAAKRREFEDMKIIDINEDQMRGDPNVWLTKVRY